jgi:uncharacterized membrane protein
MSSGQLAPARDEPTATTQQPSGVAATKKDLSASRNPTAAPVVKVAEERVVSFRVDGVPSDDVLNIRSSPDAASALVGAIPAGTANVDGLGMPSVVGQTTWQRVRHGDAVGWVNARFLKPNAGEAAPASKPIPNGSPVLQPLVCFGTEPFWAIEFGADGSATCSQSCEGPDGLRVVNIQTSPAGEPEGFDILTSKGDTYLRAVMERTGKCSDGMSDNRHPFLFSGVGVPGPLSGCCRVKEKGT